MRFRVTNIGTRAGTETAQVYLGFPAALEEPPRQLAGWLRVSLAPGEGRKVDVIIDPTAACRPLSYWKTQVSRWKIAPGTYNVFVGASSRDIRLTGSVVVP